MLGVGPWLCTEQHHSQATPSAIRDDVPPPPPHTKAGPRPHPALVTAAETEPGLPGLSWSGAEVSCLGDLLLLSVPFLCASLLILLFLFEGHELSL